MTRTERRNGIVLETTLAALLAASLACIVSVQASASRPAQQPSSQTSSPVAQQTQPQKAAPQPQDTAKPPQQAAPKPAPEKKPPDPEQELRQLVQDAENDRAALVRNLEEYLKRFPDTPRKVEIYRAILESSIQLHDSARATNYAERIVALDPEDISISLLAIDLLERAGEDAGLIRATDYASRVLDRVQKSPITSKSPRVSEQEWEQNKKRLAMTVYLIRGRLWKLRRNYDTAVQDLESSLKLLPNAPAAEKLGEVAELRGDFPRAIDHYASAFVLPDDYGIRVDRAEVRRKLGNVWKQVHGKETGLGEKVLAAYDQTLAQPAKNVRNKDAKQPLDFELRRAHLEEEHDKKQEKSQPQNVQDSQQSAKQSAPQSPPQSLHQSQDQPVKLADSKGKVIVLNFWATWCGPCRDLEPIFDALGRQYERNVNVVFLAASSDEDEARVPPYVQREKIRSTVVFADGLDRNLGVNAFPTTIVLDRSGKVVYRAEGFNPQTFQKTLNDVIQRALASGS